MTVLELIDGLKKAYDNNDFFEANILVTEYLWAAFPKTTYHMYMVEARIIKKIGSTSGLIAGLFGKNPNFSAIFSDSFNRTAENLAFMGECRQKGLSFKESLTGLVAELNRNPSRGFRFAKY